MLRLRSKNERNEVERRRAEAENLARAEAKRAERLVRRREERRARREATPSSTSRTTRARSPLTLADQASRVKERKDPRRVDAVARRAAAETERSFKVTPQS